MGFLEVSPPQSAWLSFWYQGQASTDKEPEQPSGALPGLANLGNTCFMNATLQCVLNTPAWLAEACRSFQKPELEGNGVSGRLVLGRGFADLLQTYNSTQSQALSRTNSSLKNMKSAIATLDDRYAGCKQQDAYEFLGCLLEGLEENFQRLYHHGEARAGNSPTAGIIRAICGVETHASRTCHGCKSCFKVDRVTDTALRLPLISPEAQMDKAVRETEEKKPISVEELLAAAQQPETIDGYDCDVCHASAKRGGTDHVRTSMTQQAGVISSTGDILVIVLYRFCHTLDDGPTKVRRQVACPTRLSLESGEYQLFGCVSHVGANLSSGHYIAAVRSHRDDMWYECDDETVKPLNINSLYAGKPVSSMRTGSDPYILFYHRQNRPQLHETQAAPQVEEANNSVTDIPEEISISKQLPHCNPPASLLEVASADSARMESCDAESKGLPDSNSCIDAESNVPDEFPVSNGDVEQGNNASTEGKVEPSGGWILVTSPDEKCTLGDDDVDAPTCPSNLQLPSTDQGSTSSAHQDGSIESVTSPSTSDPSAGDQEDSSQDVEPAQLKRSFSGQVLRRNSKATKEAFSFFCKRFARLGEGLRASCESPLSVWPATGDWEAMLRR